MKTMSGQHDLSQLMKQVNQLVFESSSANRYATFFFGELDPETKILQYINAGHNPPVVIRGDECIPLMPTGLVVGLFAEAIFEQGCIQLKSGDVFLAYTDGISEAMNSTGEEWGEEMLLQVARKQVGHAGGLVRASSLIRSVFDEADQFTAGVQQYDDMTVVVCSIH